MEGKLVVKIVGKHITKALNRVKEELKSPRIRIGPYLKTILLIPCSVYPRL